MALFFQKNLLWKVYSVGQRIACLYFAKKLPKITTSNLNINRKSEKKNIKLSENHLPLLNINLLEFIILRAPANLNPARELKLIEFLAGHDLFSEFRFECETNAKWSEALWFADKSLLKSSK